MNQAAKEYWNKKIRRWSESCYGESETEGAARNAQPSGGGSIMSRLRSSVDARMETASELLAPHVEGKRVLEFGCGNGELACRMLEAGAAHVECWDIADEAIELSRRRVAEAGFAGQATFHVGDPLDAAELPEVDIACGLGFLDWIALEEADALASRLRAKHVLFSFSEQDNSVAEWVHRVYLVWRLKLKNQGFGARHFRRDDALALFARNGWPDARIVKTKAMRFGVLLHNLPAKPEPPASEPPSEPERPAQ